MKKNNNINFVALNKDKDALDKLDKEISEAIKKAVSTLR